MSDDNIEVTTIEDAPEAVETQEVETETKENEEIEAKETESEEAEELEETEEIAKPKNGFKKRIDKLKAREQKALEEVDYWRREAQKGNTQTDETLETKPEGKPHADDYDSHEDFVEALTDYKLEAKLKERDEAKSKNAKENTEREVAANFSEKVSKFSESKPDFVEVMESADEDIQFSRPVQEAIFESDLGPEVLYELAKNPELAEKISSMTTASAIRAIGRLEAKFEVAPENETKIKKITKAPKPLSKSKGSGKVSKDLNDPNLSQAEWEKLRNEQRAS